MRRQLIVLFLGVAWLAVRPAHAAAEVRRCVTPGGQSVFTDRKCDELGASERPASASAAADRIAHASGCARTLQDLVFEMTTAIDTRDANRLAGLYHWAGMSADAGYRIWARLDAIANRPLVDIVPVMPAVTPAAPLAAHDTGAVAAKRKLDDPSAVDGNLYPQATVRRDPVALRVEQTVGDGPTPSRTVFGLTRHFDCWWVQF